MQCFMHVVFVQGEQSWRLSINNRIPAPIAGDGPASAGATPARRPGGARLAAAQRIARGGCCTVLCPVSLMGLIARHAALVERRRPHVSPRQRSTKPRRGMACPAGQASQDTSRGICFFRSCQMAFVGVRMAVTAGILVCMHSSGRRPGSVAASRIGIEYPGKDQCMEEQQATKEGWAGSALPAS